MFEMHAHQNEAFEYTRGVVGSVIACFVLIACLVIADQIVWNDQAPSNQPQYDHHHWNTSG